MYIYNIALSSTAAAGRGTGQDASTEFPPAGRHTDLSTHDVNEPMPPAKKRKQK